MMQLKLGKGWASWTPTVWPLPVKILWLEGQVLTKKKWQCLSMYSNSSIAPAQVGGNTQKNKIPSQCCDLIGSFIQKLPKIHWLNELLLTFTGSPFHESIGVEFWWWGRTINYGTRLLNFGFECGTNSHLWLVTDGYRATAAILQPQL